MSSSGNNNKASEIFRPELSTKTLVEEIHKTNSDAMRMATKMEEYPFTMKECERALDDLIAKEEGEEEEEEDDGGKKKKQKKDESARTPARATLKERKAAWLEKKKSSSNGPNGTRRRMVKNKCRFQLRVHDCGEENEGSGGGGGGRVVS